MKKKILITASTFPRWEGDTEPRFILDYAKSIQEYYDVTVMAPASQGAADQEVLEGVKVIRYHYFPIHRFETLCYPGAIVPRIKQKKARALLVPFLLFSMRRRLKKERKNYDLVHAHWLIPQGISQSGVKKIPYILTGHGGDITSLNKWPIKNMKIKAMKRASHITVVSNKLKEYITSVYPNDKTTVMAMGCDTNSFTPQNRIDNYFGQGNKKVVLFVGRLAEVKGVEYLIEAMSNIDDAILVIVGKGELEDELKKKAEPYGEKIVFLGAKTHKELSTIVPSADVFVAPSVTASDGGKEGFGLVIIEAMASGVPVIASNSGGIPNTVINNVNGILTEERDVNGIANAINNVLNNEELRSSLVANGLTTAKKHDYKEVAAVYKDIIDKAIQSNT